MNNLLLNNQKMSGLYQKLIAFNYLSFSRYGFKHQGEIENNSSFIISVIYKYYLFETCSIGNKQVSVNGDDEKSSGIG